MFILVAFSLLLTQKQYFGDPIDCTLGLPITVADADPGFRSLLDTFCWIQSTYTLPEARTGIYPGVHGLYNPGTGEMRTRKYHTYYQWVTLLLYLQAVMFYVPRYLWKTWEGGKMKMLVDGLQLPVIDEALAARKKEMMVAYFKMNLNENELYAYKYILCEFLNFINVIAQIFITDAFVGYEFTTYGMKVFEESRLPSEYRNDPLEYVFPKVTKCDFHHYGPSGSPKNIDAICILPLNVFNEKIYIVLWYWFVLIGIFSAIGLAYRCSTFFPNVRQRVLKYNAKLSNADDVEVVTNISRFGDWFLLHKIADNVDPFVFKDFMTDLARDLKSK